MTDQKPDLANDLAAFAANLAADTLPAEVGAATQANILDTLACALAGSSAPGVADIRALVDEWGGAEQATVWVTGRRAPAHHVAWLNSVMAHARDYDDTHDAAILHAGISSVPAAIAAAQLSGCSGADLIAAVAAGLEVTCRLGVATKVDLITSGFIYSSLLGYFGATAAAGRALGLDAAQMLDAFGIVYSSVAGNHQVTRDASLMKRVQPGLAAQAAVVAVQLAKRGFRGARHIFEGEDGFIRVYLGGRLDADQVRADLGSRFELLNLSYKPYPCCRDTHSAIDAVLALREAHPRDAAEIEGITVGTTAGGYQMVCVPEAVRAAPKTVVEAQFSIPYTVAAAWIDGSIGLGHFTPDGVARPDVLDLALRVRPYVDDAIERDWSRFVPPALVTVTFRDGTSVSRQVDYAKGHPENPMSSAETIRKARDCALYCTPPLPGAETRLAAAVETLPATADVAALVDAVT
jgi:2-methylcitrate dehydratase PrpD